VLAFPLYGKVRVIRVETLPARRGPPEEGRACYQDLTVAANVSQEAPSD
jgi:ribosome-associated heat shock protein Hsp15